MARQKGLPTSSRTKKQLVEAILRSDSRVPQGKKRPPAPSKSPANQKGRSSNLATPTKLQLKHKTKAQLVQLARQMGLSTSNLNKDQLVETILGPLPKRTALGRMKKADLVALAKHRSVDASGTKDDIIKKLRPGFLARWFG